MGTPFPVSDFKSDYLCDVCGGIVYCELDDASRQFCINPLCQKYDHTFTILDPSAKASPRLHEELEQEEAKLLALIESYDHKTLAMYVYSMRLTLIDSAVTGRVMPSIPMWHAIGDLLIKDTSKKVWMVANGPCDLIRATDPDRSILLIPGTLQLLSEPIKDRERLRTELLEFEGNQFRIVWDHTNFISKRHDDIKDWVDREGCSRSLRLRLPFALQIQQKFATHLTRVGQPVPPPHYELVDLESYWEGEDGNYQVLREPINNGAFIIYLKDKNSLVFTVECAEALLGEVDKVIERHERKIGSLDTTDGGYQTKKAGLEANLRSLRACKEDCEILIILEKPLPLNFTNKKDLKPHALCLYLNGMFDGPYDARTPICLNIKYGSTLQNANDSPSEVSPTTETGNEVTNG